MELKITIRLTFTEAGHGKSPYDGVGGNIKTQVEAAMLNNFGQNAIEAIHSVADVKKHIREKNNLSYHITIHTKEEIERVKETMPKLGPLVGALNLHEVLVSADVLLQKKVLPSDKFYIFNLFYLFNLSECSIKNIFIFCYFSFQLLCF